MIKVIQHFVSLPDPYNVPILKQTMKTRYWPKHASMQTTQGSKCTQKVRDTSRWTSRHAPRHHKWNPDYRPFIFDPGVFPMCNCIRALPHSQRITVDAREGYATLGRGRDRKKKKLSSKPRHRERSARSVLHAATFCADAVGSQC